MILNSRGLVVLAQNAHSNGRHLRGANRTSRRKRSHRWWAKRFLEQFFSVCMRFRYVLMLLVLSFIFISFKNQVLLPENVSAGWTSPSGVMETAGDSDSALSVWPRMPTVTSESPATVVPSEGQLLSDGEGLADTMQDGTAPLVSTPAEKADNAES